MYYDIIDPGIFTLAISTALGGFIQMLATSKNYAYKWELTIVTSLIIIYGILFLIFNFRKSYQKQLSKGKKPHDMSLFMFLYAFTAFCASISMIMFGASLIYYAYKNDVDKNKKEDDFDKMSSSEQVYFYVTGTIVMMTGFMGFIRLPIDYLLGAIGVYWLSSIFF